MTIFLVCEISDNVVCNCPSNNRQEQQEREKKSSLQILFEALLYLLTANLV